MKTLTQTFAAAVFASLAFSSASLASETLVCENVEIKASIAKTQDLRADMTITKAGIQGEETSSMTISANIFEGTGPDASYFFDNGRGSLIVDYRGIAELVIDGKTYTSMACSII